MTNDPQPDTALGREARDTLAGAAVRLDEIATSIAACALAIRQVIALLAQPGNDDA